MPVELIVGMVAVAGSGWAIVSWGVRRIATGDLLPRKIHESITGALQHRVDVLEKQSAELSAQNSLLLREGLPTTNALLDSMKALVDEARGVSS